MFGYHSQALNIAEHLNLLARTTLYLPTPLCTRGVLKYCTPSITLAGWISSSYFRWCFWSNLFVSLLQKLTGLIVLS